MDGGGGGGGGGGGNHIQCALITFSIRTNKFTKEITVGM